MALCRAIIQQGPRKGLTCQNPPSNDYCLHHQRNSEYDQWIQEGKHPCGMFFRGCDQETTEEERAQGYIHCITCRQKKRRKGFPCQAPGCPSTIPTEEQRYCKKHPMYSRCHHVERPLTTKDKWRALQQNAYEKGLFFMIPFEEAEQLFEQPCFYCGNPSNTIDRTDPTKGYLLSSLPCCLVCQTMKGTDTPLEFLDRIMTDSFTTIDPTKKRDIQSYCDRNRLEDVRMSPLKPYRGRSYSVAQIYEIMADGSYHHFIQWCLETKTPEFLSAMNEIRHGSFSREESLHRIKDELEYEQNRKRIPLSEKKTLHASTMYAYLVMGKIEQIRGWYTSRYTPSVLYEERLRDLMDRLPTLDSPAGKEACQQMMMEENHRRIAQERRNRERCDRERCVLQEVDPFAIPAVPVPFDLPEMSEISMTYRSHAIHLPEVDPLVLPCAP